MNKTFRKVAFVRSAKHIFNVEQIRAVIWRTEDDGKYRLEVLYVDGTNTSMTYTDKTHCLAAMDAIYAQMESVYIDEDPV